MAKGEKYQALTAYLVNQNKDTIILSFRDIETILNFKLTQSAYKYPAFWSNDTSHMIGYGWLNAGYKACHLNLHSQQVTFVKDNILELKNVESYSLKAKRIKQRQTINNIIITNELINKAHDEVKATSNYGKEDNLITDCFKRFPNNTDLTIVAMKVGLIDITNSTHVSQHKSKISAVEIAECIVNIKNIDERIKNGDPEVVNEIARSNGKINLFSFATKFCCYHNKNLYGKDDYSILDTVVKENLPKYFNDITSRMIQKWQDNFDYKSYNDYIGKKLDELGINTDFRRRKFDHYIWYSNR